MSVADQLDQLAGLARAAGRVADADRLAHLATRIHDELRGRDSSWTAIQRALSSSDVGSRDAALIERLRRADHDEVGAAVRRLPPAARALVRDGTHPLRHRLGELDLLLDVDLARLLEPDEVVRLMHHEPSSGTPLGRAWMQAQQMREELSSVTGVVTWHLAGGLRRMDAISPDVVQLAVVDEPVPWVRRAVDDLHEQVVVAGSHSLAVTADPEPLVVHAVPPREAATRVLWYTGPFAHVAALRARAATRGLALAADALRRGDTPLALDDEREVYSHLDLPFIPVELRDRPGILAEADAGRLSMLIELGDIRGDLHMHTVYSDGRDSVIGMVRAAQALGYAYVAITDHSPTARASRVLTLDRLKAQAEEIAQVRDAMPGMTILHGIECDIQDDGTLDVPDAVLEQLDLVLASLHQDYGHSADRLLARYRRAMQHPLVNVITHPANRSPGRTPGYALDFPRLFEEAARTGTAIEIDGAPGHLDLDAPLAEAAAQAGARIVIDSDCHMADRLGRQMQFGVGLARKAGLTRTHVLNTGDIAEVRAFVQAKRAGRA